MKSKNKPRTLRVEDNRFSGIIVTLKKRMHIPLYEGKDDFGYTLFGHYDGMEIREVNNWFKFLPAGIENKKSETEIKDNVLDIYTLKACVPVNSTELEEMGFRYDIWGDEPLKAADGGEFLLSYPLVACSLLHLRKECVAETDINNLINEISGKISKSADFFFDRLFGYYSSVSRQ